MDSLLDYDEDLLTPPWGALGRDVVLGTVATVSKLLLNVFNTTRVINHATYTDLVMHRPPGVGLLTVSNHTSTYDDPGLPCALLPLSFFWTEHRHHKNRWTMCAKDICFKNHLLKQFFLNGKVLPVERGAGVAQHSISVAARALGGGDWLHIFPEGRVVPDGHVGPFRQGIGKLICEARAVTGRDPIILPFFHSGMARVMPFKSSIPRVGQEVAVAVGQPLDLAHITCRCNQPGEDQHQVWRDLAVALRHAVMELQDQVPQNPNQLTRADVAEYERKYQERQRRAREQQQLTGGQEPALRVQGDGEQAGGVACAGGVAVGRGQQVLLEQQRLMQQVTQQEWEQEWEHQEEQLLAVVRRISQQQLELQHSIDVVEKGKEQDQCWSQQMQAHWQRGQQLLHTWQQLQDRQVAFLLSQSRAVRTDSSSSSGFSSTVPQLSSSGNSSSSDGSWAVAWLPFFSPAAQAASTAEHAQK